MYDSVWFANCKSISHARGAYTHNVPRGKHRRRSGVYAGNTMPRPPILKHLFMQQRICMCRPQSTRIFGYRVPSNCASSRGERRDCTRIYVATGNTATNSSDLACGTLDTSIYCAEQTTRLGHSSVVWLSKSAKRAREPSGKLATLKLDQAPATTFVQDHL